MEKLIHDLEAWWNNKPSDEDMAYAAGSNWADAFKQILSLAKSRHDSEMVKELRVWAKGGVDKRSIHPSAVVEFYAILDRFEKMEAK